MLKKLLLLFIFSNSIAFFSQGKFSLDSLSSKEKATSYLSYYQDISKKETIETIQEKQFSFYGEKVFPLEYEQKVWFKLLLHKSEKNKEEFLFLLNTVSIGKLNVYQYTETGYKKQFSFQKNGELSIQIPINFLTTTTNYLFEVVFTEGVFFPIEIDHKRNLDKLQKQNLIIYGLYYGFVFVVLLINFFFYKQTKELFFIYYILLTISITLILLELDGFAYKVFGNISWVLSLDAVLDTFLLISAMLFTTEALELNKYMPKLKWLGVILIIANTLSYLIYILTDILFWYSLGEFFNLIGLCFYWIIVIWFLKRLMFARFMFIAYTVLYLANVFYVLPSQFGIMDLGFKVSIFKIGSVIEMLVFLYAISYRHKSLYEEKESIELELESHKELLLKKDIETETSEQQKLEQFSVKFKFTVREIQVLNYIIQGKNNKEIAKELHLTEATIKYHCSKMYDKTGVKNRSQLTALFNNPN